MEFKIELNKDIEINVKVTFKEQTASITLKEFNELSISEMERILFKRVDNVKII